MPRRPELPTTFLHGLAAYNVMPDVKAMTWGVWDLDGWIGEIHGNGAWSAAGRAGDQHGPYLTWRDAVVGLLDGRPIEFG